MQSTIPPFQTAASTSILPPPNPRGYYQPSMPPLHYRFPSNGLILLMNNHTTHTTILYLYNYVNRIEKLVSQSNS